MFRWLLGSCRRIPNEVVDFNNAENIVPGTNVRVAPIDQFQANNGLLSVKLGFIQQELQESNDALKEKTHELHELHIKLNTLNAQNHLETNLRSDSDMGIKEDTAFLKSQLDKAEEIISALKADNKKLITENDELKLSLKAVASESEVNVKKVMRIDRETKKMKADLIKLLEGEGDTNSKQVTS